MNTYRAVKIEAGFWVVVWYVNGAPHEVLKRWYTSWWNATANRVYLECLEDRRRGLDPHTEKSADQLTSLG